MNRHPSEAQLALFAGGDVGLLTRYFVGRHVHECRECTAEVGRFEMLRAHLSETDSPELDWSRISGEMRANIRLGLEAGECVRTQRKPGVRTPRLAFAGAGLALLVAAGFLMKGPAPVTVKANTPVLESTGSGLELREGASSLTILNHHGVMANQTVSAQGEIGARYIDGDSGAVTINNVYLE